MLVPLASAATSGSGGFSSLLLVLPLLLILFLIVNDRRRRKQVQQVQEALTVGEEVMTTTGLFGTIIRLEDTVVHLQVAPGVVVRWARAAVLPLAAAQSQLRGRGTAPGRSDERGGEGPADRSGETG